MEKDILSRIDGISIYGVVSVSMFFVFFTGMLVWAFLRKQSYLAKMSTLPLDGGEVNANEKIKSEKL